MNSTDFQKFKYELLIHYFAFLIHPFPKWVPGISRGVNSRWTEMLKNEGEKICGKS